MPAINANWARWILASASDHFETGRDSIPFYMEGADFSSENDDQWVEFRLDGPDIKQISYNYWRFDIEINLLVSSVMDHEDFHKQVKLVGQFANLVNVIQIYKYGNQVGDDDSFIGCLELRKDLDEVVVISNFGKIRPDTRLIQSTIEGHYQMFLGG